MKRGRGRPPKNPVSTSKLLNSEQRGSQNGRPSPKVDSPQGPKTRGLARSTPRKTYFEGLPSSDSDTDSDSSYESTVSTISSVSSYRTPRVIPMRTVTPLRLPPSSDDLLLPDNEVIKALGIYEVLRQFGRVLRLSPFRFEDFCAAIASEEQSSLLSEVHLSLFKALLLEDETNGLTFTASDEKDSFNIFVHELDGFTWPEHIRSYINSDKLEFADLESIVRGRSEDNPYPFASIEDRLTLLQRLSDLFLSSNSIREEIINEGMLESEDHCRSCGKMGDLLCCEICPGVYHLQCLKPPLEQVPTGDWLCPVCEAHQVKGVTDCHLEWTKDGWLRNAPLGMDREGRKYWFLSRRLFVEGEQDSLYFSSKAHLDDLIRYLVADGQERKLLAGIRSKYNEITKQMAITEALVDAVRGDKKSGLLARRKQVSKEDAKPDEDGDSTKQDDKAALDVNSTLDSKAIASTDVKTESADTPSKSVSLTFISDAAVPKLFTAPPVDKKPEEQDIEESKRAAQNQESNNDGDGLKETNPSVDLKKDSGCPLKQDENVKLSGSEAHQGKKECASSPTMKPSQQVKIVLSKVDSIDGPKVLVSLAHKDTKMENMDCDSRSHPTETFEEGGLGTPDVNMKVEQGTTLVVSKKQDTTEDNDASNESSSHATRACCLNFEPQGGETPKTTDHKQDVDATSVFKKTKEELVPMEIPTGPFFRLGEERNFTLYVNQFSINPQALNKHQHGEYRERKRAVNNKFCTTSMEFKWTHEIFGSKEVILNTLRSTIVSLENNIPTAFMHPVWPLQRSTWVRAVHISEKPLEFAAALSFLETLIKPVCFIPAWTEAHGHTGMHRALVETKAEKAQKKRDHKDEEEEVEIKEEKVFVNYSWIPTHTVWKQKGEEYRIFGNGGWTWCSDMQSRKRKRFLTKDKNDFESKKRKLTHVVDGINTKKELRKKQEDMKRALAAAKIVKTERVNVAKGVTQGMPVTKGRVVTQGMPITPGRVVTQGKVVTQGMPVTPGRVVTQGMPVTPGRIVTQGIPVTRGRVVTQGTVVTKGMPVTPERVSLQGTVVTQGTAVTQGIPVTPGRVVMQGMSVTQRLPITQTAVTQGTLMQRTQVTQGISIQNTVLMREAPVLPTPTVSAQSCPQKIIPTTKFPPYVPRAERQTVTTAVPVVARDPVSPAVTQRPITTMSTAVVTQHPASTITTPAVTQHPASTITTPAVTQHPASTITTPAVTQHPASTITTPAVTQHPASTITTPAVTQHPASTITTPAVTQHPASTITVPVVTQPKVTTFTEVAVTKQPTLVATMPVNTQAVVANMVTQPHGTTIVTPAVANMVTQPHGTTIVTPVVTQSAVATKEPARRTITPVDKQSPVTTIVTPAVPEASFAISKVTNTKLPNETSTGLLLPHNITAEESSAKKTFNLLQIPVQSEPVGREPLKQNADANIPLTNSTSENITRSDTNPALEITQAVPDSVCGKSFEGKSEIKEKVEESNAKVTSSQVMDTNIIKGTSPAGHLESKLPGNANSSESLDEDQLPAGSVSDQENREGTTEQDASRETTPRQRGESGVSLVSKTSSLTEESELPCKGSSVEKIDHVATPMEVSCIPNTELSEKESHERFSSLEDDGWVVIDGTEVQETGLEEGNVMSKDTKGEFASALCIDSNDNSGKVFPVKGPLMDSNEKVSSNDCGAKTILNHIPDRNGPSKTMAISPDSSNTVFAKENKDGPQNSKRMDIEQEAMEIDEDTSLQRNVSDFFEKSFEEIRCERKRARDSLLVEDVQSVLGNSVKPRNLEDNSEKIEEVRLKPIATKQEQSVAVAVASSASFRAQTVAPITQPALSSPLVAQSAPPNSQAALPVAPVIPPAQSTTQASQPVSGGVQLAPSAASSTQVTRSVASSTHVTPSVASSTQAAPSVTLSTEVTTSVTSSTQVTPSVASSTQAATSVTTSTQGMPSVAPSTQMTPSVASSTQVTPSVASSTQAAPSVTPSTQMTPSVTPSTQAAPSVASSTQVAPSMAPSTQTGHSVTPSSQAGPSAASCSQVAQSIVATAPPKPTVASTTYQAPSTTTTTHPSQQTTISLVPAQSSPLAALATQTTQSVPHTMGNPTTPRPPSCLTQQTSTLTSTPAKPAVSQSIKIARLQNPGIVTASLALKPRQVQPISTTKYVPIGPKPILPNPSGPQVPLGGNVVRLSTPLITTSGGATPVGNIAALVASIPGNMVTNVTGNVVVPGQTQLIRIVTPSGQTFTVQGTIQGGPGATSGGTSIRVPVSIKTSLGLTQQQGVRPIAVAPKTVGASTPKTAVSMTRLVQSSTSTPSKLPPKQEKYPMVEPLVRDPRKLLDNRIAKWRRNRHSVKSVFRLSKRDLRVLGRRAGMREVQQFMYTSRGTGITWPASFPRPSFKVAWRYRTQSLQTLAGAGLQLRILHACLKWDEINVRPPRSNSTTISTSTGTTTTEIVDHRYVSPDGLQMEFLVRKTIRTLRKPVSEIPRSPPPTTSKRGRTLRPKITLNPEFSDDEEEMEPVNMGPKVFQTWCPEEKLELWEIRQYQERREREKALEQEKKLQEEAMKRAAEMRAAAVQKREQEQQVKQQQRLLKMNQKKVQNAIKTQRKVAATTVTHAMVNPAYKSLISSPTLASPQVVSALRQTAPKQQPVVVRTLQPQTAVSRPQVTMKPPVIMTPYQRAQMQPGMTPQASTIRVQGAKTVTKTPQRSRSTPKMKHSSKEQQQAKQQSAKSKGKKTSTGGNVPILMNRKLMSLESRQDLSRIAICRKVIDSMLHKIERNESTEKAKEHKREEENRKREKAKLMRLDGLLYKRKEALRKEIMKKRLLLEKELTTELVKSSKAKATRDETSRKRRHEESQGDQVEPVVEKRPKWSEDTTLYCICKKPYDATRFYVGCDLCANWFHGACVNITPEEAAAMDHWSCKDCKREQQDVEQEEVYCLCRQPYDETKFYVGCDSCQDWFHGACVGISENEADQLESYVCPRCKENQSKLALQPLTNRDHDSLKRMLRSLQSHKMAWPFLEPVSGLDVPGYYDVIKEPMDLSTVEDKITSKKYATLEQFVSDVTRIFDNCRFFNGKDTPYYRCAEVLEAVFVQKLRAWKSKK
ncbi:nucleosome-remodeling factor subunit BPTF isoform X2 [Nematostella vectensis]|uniref:nucleosome-remodeling factor subunit BPTF isoform X2 n=1 Tax=Nematostella vectensis TaxID=45351 RepID=UPI0020776BF5|nr:nucleosome-remodeling factor subunit BPTF isoform X2 [Nematostella vectensis]